MAVQTSTQLHQIGQGFAGKRVPGQRWLETRLSDKPPSPEAPCPTCGKQVTATTCTVWRAGKTYQRTTRQCTSVAKRNRYGKPYKRTVAPCEVRVEELEISEMANPTGKNGNRAGLRNTKASADEIARFHQAKHESGQINSQIKEKAAVCNAAFYDWLSGRNVTEETHSKMLAAMDAMDHAPSPQQVASLRSCMIGPEELSRFSDQTQDMNSRLEDQLQRMKQYNTKLDARLEQSSGKPEIEESIEAMQWSIRKIEKDVYAQASEFYQHALAMAAADPQLLQHACAKALEQVSRG